jgi:succinate dehydrogenase / fumarate reductase cytochrome b subunit
MQQKGSHRTHPMPMSPRLSVYRLHPVTLASGAHRISGLVLILFIPFYMWLLTALTGSPDEFQNAIDLLHTFWGKLALWMVGMALIYHLLNGVRFLTIDAGWTDERDMMRYGAKVMLAITAVLAPLLGVLLWL